MAKLNLNDAEIGPMRTVVPHEGWCSAEGGRLGMAQDNKRGVASVLNAVGACAGLLEQSPRHLREVAHHHFVSDQLSEELIGKFFDQVGLPPLQLQHPVVLLGRESQALRLPVGPVQQGAFSRCGRYYAVGAGKGMVVLVDRRSGEQRFLEGHEGVVRSVVFSSCGELLYSMVVW